MIPARTVAIASGELLRARPATRMINYVALEVVRHGKATELWHVVPNDRVGVEALIKEWTSERGLSEKREDAP